MNNTHRAYELHDGYTPPRHKLIASGSETFCSEQADAHREKHGVTVGVVEALKDGNPWASEWPEEKQ